MSRYRVRTSKLYLTYPQCTLSKEEAYDLLWDIFNPKELLVAFERHKNGDPHLHSYVELHESKEYVSCNFADIGGFHGNYQSCRSEKRVLQYCTKEDNFKSTFDVNVLLQGGKASRAIVGKRILEGTELTTIVEEFPQYIFGYKKLKTDIEEYKEDKRIDQRDELPGELPNPWNKRMPVDLDNKKCHYWVYSHEPDRGKTTAFLEPIYENYKACWKDQTEPYWTIAKDTEIIIFDEIERGHLKHSALNMICNGKKEYRLFQGGNIKLPRKPLVIICSNFSIKEVFPYAYKLVEIRFIEICVD